MKLPLCAAFAFVLLAVPSRAHALGPLWNGTLGVKVTDVDEDGVLSAGDRLEVSTNIICSGEGQQDGLDIQFPLSELLEPVPNSVTVTGDGSGYASVITGGQASDREVYVAYDNAAFGQNLVVFTVRVVDPLPASLPSTNITFRGDLNYIVDYWDDAAGNLTEATTTNTVSFYLGQSLAGKKQYSSTLIARFINLEREFDFDAEKIYETTFAEEVTIYNAGPYDVEGLEIRFGPVDFAKPAEQAPTCTFEESVQPHFCAAYDPATCGAPSPEAKCLQEAELPTFRYEGRLAAGTHMTVTWDTQLLDRDVETYAEVATYAVAISATVLSPKPATMAVEQQVTTTYLVTSRLAVHGAMSPLAAVLPLLFAGYYLWVLRRRQAVRQGA